jgi:spore maturation protein CgeB
MNTTRVLYLGDNWFGSCARAVAYALRRAGCNVLDIDYQCFIPQVSSNLDRAVRRVFRKSLMHAYNDEVLRRAESFRPDILLAFKGQFVEPRTLRVLRERGVHCYNYYPDRMILAKGLPEGECIAEYDCIFDTKRAWDGNADEPLKCRERHFVPHGYDPEVHRPRPLDERDIRQYECDISVVAWCSPRKYNLLKEVIRLRPSLKFNIWGENWGGRGIPGKYVQGHGLFGEQYSRAIQATRINLAFLGVTDAIRDETTTRTFEIPACGGFMLHERTEEVLQLYKEGVEMACYGSPEELVEKVDYYLAHPAERGAIAQAGYRRCVPAYSYDNRIAEILRWHCERFGGEIAATVAQGSESE